MSYGETMKAVQFYNEKGNALPKVREAMKASVLDNLTIAGQTLQTNARGENFIQIAVDEATGNPIYATVALTISDLDMPAREKVVRQPKEKAAAEPVEVSLFD